MTTCQEEGPRNVSVQESALQHAQGVPGVGVVVGSLDCGSSWSHLFLLPPLALPVHFKTVLKNEEATESGTATFHCELTKAVGSVEWMKDHKVLRPSDKYRMRLEGRFAELTVQDLELTDAGSYTCVCVDQKTTAALKVNGNEVYVGSQGLLACKLSQTIRGLALISCGSGHPLLHLALVLIHKTVPTYCTSPCKMPPRFHAGCSSDS